MKLIPKKRIANRVTELEIRHWLNASGDAGSAARFIELELHAIERPGWLQIYRFEVQVRTSIESHSGNISNWQTRWGVVRDDERCSSQADRLQISIYSDRAAQASKLAELSAGLITCRAGQSGSLIWGLAIMAAILTIAVLFGQLT